MRILAVSLLLLGVAFAGCRTSPISSSRDNLPPAQALLHPGPGVDGPGPGVMMGPPAEHRPGHNIADFVCWTRRRLVRVGRRRARRL